ncbi:hypothetical protein MKEN_00995200 [Mycena kentingensis (nom. inval.)]|nr:hypothetical protein MKEN_00995200 [Mycena kentingensis (nom. inval.)]
MNPTLLTVSCSPCTDSVGLLLLWGHGQSKAQASCQAVAGFNRGQWTAIAFCRLSSRPFFSARNLSPWAAMSASPSGGWEAFQYSTIVADKRLANSLFVFAFSVLLYDHFLTLPVEVRFIWAHPKRPSALWFLLNRYYALVTNILMAAFTFVNFPPWRCAGLLLAKKVFLMGQQVIVYVILVLRVYAMFNLNRKLLGALLGAGWLTTSPTDKRWGLPAGYDSALNATSAASTFPPIPDYGSPNQSNGRLPPGYALAQCAEPVFHASAIRIAAAWEAILGLETIIFALTVYRAVAFRRIAGRYHTSSLMRCLLRDGVWYFFAIVMVNAANLFMYYFGDPFLAPSLSWLASDLSATLVARLMLNLHKAADGGIYEVRTIPHDDLQSHTSVAFANQAESTRGFVLPGNLRRFESREWPSEVVRYVHEMQELQRDSESDDSTYTRLPERVFRKPISRVGGHGLTPISLFPTYAPGTVRYAFLPGYVHAYTHRSALPAHVLAIPFPQHVAGARVKVASSTTLVAGKMWPWGVVWMVNSRLMPTNDDGVDHHGRRARRHGPRDAYTSLVGAKERNIRGRTCPDATLGQGSELDSTTCASGELTQVEAGKAAPGPGSCISILAGRTDDPKAGRVDADGVGYDPEAEDKGDGDEEVESTAHGAERRSTDE